MSRVRVLNLPRTTTEDDLRAHFSQPVRGAGPSALPLEITDCRVVRKQGETTLRMAFVGFRTTSAGQRAIKLFNGSYIGAQKITVEPAQSLVEQRAERAKEADAKQQQHEAYLRRRGYPVDGDAKPEPEVKRGPMAEHARLKEEFIDRTAKQARAPGWAKEVFLPTETEITQTAAAEVSAAAAIAAAELEALERQKRDEVDDSDFLAGITSTTKHHDVEATAAKTEAVVNAHLMPRAVTAPETEQVPKQPKLTPEQKIAAESLRVRLSNIPYTATVAEVKNFISSVVGDVAEVHLPLTKDTKQVKGVAFVAFGSRESALKALDSDGAIFMGRLIRIAAAEADPYKLKREADAKAKAEAAAAAATTPSDAADANHHNYRAEKLEKKKRTDGDLMWNPLFVESATAVAKMAGRLGVSSDAVVGVETAGAAVRAAIAEAYLTTEAQRVLGDEGINLGALEGATLHRQRSNTTILVKHLPKGMTVSELAKMFAKFGTIETIAAPSSAAFALIAFAHEDDAKSAFQRMAYKMLSGAPLFLEWAPIAALRDPGDDDVEELLHVEDANDVGAQLEKAAKKSHNDARGVIGIDDDDDDAIGAAAAAVAKERSAAAAAKAPSALPAAAAAAVRAAVVYITNLPFGLSEAAFVSFLQGTCKRLSTNPELVVKVSLLSTKGRAYVTVADAATANYVIAKVQGRSMEGRQLGAQLSTSTAAKDGRAGDDVAPEPSARAETKAHAPVPASSNGVPPDRNPLKVVVKNLPFEATERDLRELFKAFTEVRAVRVPNKVNTFSRGHHENNHRGFGFVEFLTEQEAARAIATLSNTHLYGRHLVLEYAKL